MMCSLFKKLLKREDGQSLVAFALLFVILMGSGALVIDVGFIEVKKSYVQNVTDAAALAGAMDLPNYSIAINNAKKIAEANGVEVIKTTVKTPYKGDSTSIEVVCSQTLNYTFARVLGFDKVEVYSRAVAKKVSNWSGEALPFINLDDDYSADPEIVAWEKTGPGDFESIDNYSIINPKDPDKLYFEVDYMNGIELKKGTVATVKQEVGYVYNQHKPDDTVYILSLNKNVINSGKVLLKDGSTRSLSKLKNGDIVHPNQLVLLECIFHDYDYQGTTLFLTTKKVYNIANNEFPPDYVGPNGGSSKLIE
ncbi:MAG: hypothetical protein FD141_177 [Fusobacteria bacterium]|nr:MAG: hypothetical protein FD141_177 [Fusobacteriota bacterium]KAF0229159.1 MAG: hypothetical protein FD182_1415 [Fusobacteriota bacterium]